MASIFGASYISVSEFRANAQAFDCAADLTQYTDNVLEGILARASRRAEEYCEREEGAFGPGPFVEIHSPDAHYRRVRVDWHPVAAITKLEVMTSAGTYTEVGATQLAQVVVSNQDKFVELPSSVFNALNPQPSPVAPVLGSSLLPLVRVTYTSMVTSLPPKGVMLAVGMIAASAVNKLEASKKLSPGIGSIEIVGEIKVARPTGGGDGGTADLTTMPSGQVIPLPPEAVELLKQYRRSVPRGYYPSEQTRRYFGAY
jgi:hypothetical protein